jgi:hypothetical protein
MNPKQFSESIGVAYGTVKRWLHDGMPARRTSTDQRVWVDPDAARRWIDERFRGRKTVAFERKSVVYFMQRDDGAIKIGFTSDILRRVGELRKKERSPIELLACYPGGKPDELRLHATFASSLIGDEWFRPDEDLVAFIEALRERAA